MAGQRLRLIVTKFSFESSELSFTFDFRAEIATMTTKVAKKDAHIAECMLC